MHDLDSLHKEIGKCQLCSDFIPLIKNPELKRGGVADIMVIGLSPGKVETQTQLAFSGQGGNRLFSWLIEAGVGSNDDEIRKVVYFTSLIKCMKTNISDIESMFSKCQTFLKMQIHLVQPRIVIPLGVNVFNILFDTKTTANKLLSKSFTLQEINETPLFPEMSIFFGIKYIIPFPHPSGLNRTLNKASNRILLNQSITILNRLYHEE